MRGMLDGSLYLGVRKTVRGCQSKLENKAASDDVWVDEQKWVGG
jgi:hypothetical protein